MINGKLLKICGMRESENIQRIATDIQPDLMGFIFYPPSPRYASGLDGHTLSALPEGIKRVGVFVNESLSVMRETAKRFQLNALQLHGSETPVQCVQMREEDFFIIKAFSVRDKEDIEGTEEYEGGCDLFLFDTKSSGYGGSGQSFNWDILHHYTGQTPFLLSGGIGGEDIDKLLSFQHPMLAGYDLNSRFETAPGLKDPVALQTFCQKLSIASK